MAKRQKQETDTMKERQKIQRPVAEVKRRSERPSVMRKLSDYFTLRVKQFRNEGFPLAVINTL